MCLSFVQNLSRVDTWFDKEMPEKSVRHELWLPNVTKGKHRLVKPQQPLKEVFVLRGNFIGEISNLGKPMWGLC